MGFLVIFFFRINRDENAQGVEFFRNIHSGI